MKKIKILRIIARLNIGGPAMNTIILTEGLDKTKFESLLVCGSIGKDEGDMSYYAFQKNIKPIFIPELKRELNILSDLAAFKKIYNIIRTEEPDIVHTHTAKAGALGRFAGILYNCFKPFAHKRIKLIHTFHGHIFEGYFSKIQTKFFILIERFLAPFTSKIITVSESLKKELISLKISQETKIKVIPLGLELDRFLSLLPRDDNILNIGIVGRLVPIKNHCLFLEAAAKVIADNPGIRLKFKIIGDGELRKDLEEYSYKLNIQEQVDFLGWQKDLVNIYSNLDVVALTSINEGTPVSLIEAMASGRVVVATDVGGVRDLLGGKVGTTVKPDVDFMVLERGVIVKSGDVNGFTEALVYLLDNSKLRKDMGIAGREYVRRNFGKERLIRDVEGLYEEILLGTAWAVF
jgi:glycosyltransferase involved in cell wall biosynthesis